MIKLVYCLRRLPNLTREEFQRYWRETHGPLVQKHAGALAIRRYVQVHTLDHPANSTLQETRGGPESYDGVAELWWDDAESLMRGFSTPEGQAAGRELLEDEHRFIDVGRSPLWIATERPFVEDFDGHVAVDKRIVAFVDGAHAALAQGAEDLVFIYAFH